MTAIEIIRHAARIGYTSVEISPARSGCVLRACLRFDRDDCDLAYQHYIDRNMLHPVIVKQLDEARVVNIPLK